MELATGRVVKESSTGPGGRSSDAGRYGSGRSEGEKSGGGGARDYARDGGGGRSSDRDRDRDRRGGGGDKHQYRRKGSSESRGGGGSTRHYGDSRHDKAYRYTSHRDRSSRRQTDVHRGNEDYFAVAAGGCLLTVLARHSVKRRLAVAPQQ